MFLGAGVGGRRPVIYIVLMSDSVFVSGFEFHFDGFSTKCERRNAVHFENADLAIDVVGGDSEDDDADDGNNGDFTEVADEPFVQVTHGRSSNISRSVSPSTSRSSISSGS